MFALNKQVCDSDMKQIMTYSHEHKILKNTHHQVTSYF